MQPFSPKFERLWRHELQRVRRPVKIDHVELHGGVGLAGLHAEQTVQTLARNLTSSLLLHESHTFLLSAGR